MVVGGFLFLIGAVILQVRLDAYRRYGDNIASRLAQRHADAATVIKPSPAVAKTAPAPRVDPYRKAIAIPSTPQHAVPTV